MKRFNLLQITKSIQRFRSSRLTRNTFWTTMIMPLNALFGTLQTALTARILGPEGIGTIAIFIATVAIFTAIFTLQNGATVITFLSRSLEQKNTSEGAQIIKFSFMADFLSGIVGFLVLVVISLVAPGFIQIKPETSLLFLIYSLTVIISSTYWDSQSVLQVLNRTDITFKITFWQSILKSSILGICYIWYRNIEGYLIAILLSTLFSNISLLIASHQLLSSHGIHGSIQNHWWQVPKEVSLYSLHGFGQKVLKTFARYTDTLVLGTLTIVSEVGAYRAARQITDTIQLPLQGYISSLYAEYSRLYFANEIKRLKTLLIRSVLVSGIIGVIGSFLLFIFMKPIIRVLLGDGFSGIEKVVSVLILLPAITLTFAPATILPAMIGNQKPGLISLIVSLIVQLALLPVLVPRLGAVGAAWALVISTTFSLGFMVIPVVSILSKNNVSKPT